MSVQKQATKPEIMAPAGSFASLQAAINAGTDSIFFGVTQLNMRARAASNLSLEDMKEIASICKKAGVKAYVTMNALLYEHDLNLMRRILDEAKAAGIDAAIVQDMAAIQYATEIGMPIHASTQLSISNYETVKFYARFADTIVLARELDLKMIKNICDKIKEDDLRGPAGELIKIEVFVHGALCIAVSGRCHMSLLQTNTSAQRGACLQECRKSYRITDEETGKEMVVENNYVLSPADLCTLPFLDEMVDSGISIFKIEGRGRSPDYVDTVVRTYREALATIADGTFNQEKVQKWMSQLEKTFNRGFSSGWYLGKPLPDKSGVYGSKATEEKIFAGNIQHYFSKAKIAEINVRAHRLAKGDRLAIIGNTTGITYENADQIMRDNQFIEETNNQDLVTIPVQNRVRKNDKVYIIKKRQNLQTNNAISGGK